MLSESQAREAIKIINEECAANIRDERAAYPFIQYVTTDDSWHSKEWRFMGALGYGGKFRINHNKSHPYVDCYREDETPERLAMIEKANKRLEALKLGGN